MARSGLRPFLVLVLLGVLAFVAAAQAVTCSQSPAELQAARLTAIRAYQERLNGEVDNYAAVCDRYYTDDVHLTIRGIGTFDTLEVAKEYGYVLFNFSHPLIQELWQGRLELTLDEPSIEWSGPNNDTVQFWQTCVVRLGPIWDSPVPGQYYFVTGGTRNFETLVFAECSDRIRSDIVINDLAIMPIYAANNEPDVPRLCEKIMATCQGDLQVYPTVEACIEFMNVLDARAAGHPEGECPYKTASNTTTCRNFHATNALVDPVVHCSHTAINSPKCVDACRPACDECPLHSHCNADYASPTAETAVYTCLCDDGFVPGATGPNGATSCVPVTCTADWQCGTPYGFCDTTGNCRCPQTFEWDPINGGCHCPTDYVLTWDVPANSGLGLTAPACKPPGGCLARQHCTDQSWNRVQCIATSPPSTVSAWLACQCNYGFIGGWLNECECPHGESRVFWSTTVAAEVCLAEGECTDDWHCGGSSPSCSIATNAVVGTCA
ncbi:zinc finger protein [Acanthamoeba castellanii str. Neff]|uniref:Zinc finger protein n=1 Tax=Acanthamoeba castellanii (strain ATCC 30010 / Neff) TaxID=1257118 RepID=L8H071_ACACF|nr:zinc finger protein [Acanthamoeba castellanii str. Neff]ELR17786.1 zinc finger protein [Acanthamoeba castellanii str. Neff]